MNLPYIGLKLCWTGLTLSLAVPLFHLDPPFAIAGIVVMVIGVVLMWINK